MNILFLAQHKWPHVGGVEMHVQEISLSLRKKTHKVTTVSEEDVKYPHIKFLGLIYIWFWLFKNRHLVTGSDLVHCHDVFIWYLPFRFIYPNKPVFTTFHGWEGVYPIPFKNIVLKRIANKLSWGSVAVGKYIEKYYGIKSNKIIYGGIPLLRYSGTKIMHSIVIVGRLENDTGVLEFLKWLKGSKKYRVDFIGDGRLRGECAKYGTVHGFTDPKPFYQKAEICVPGGYLSYIEANASGCKIKVFPNNPLKKDYWNEIRTVFENGQEVKKFPTWDNIADEYIDLYNSI